MAYDALGNYSGPTEELEGLEAKYAKPDYVSQIPGQAESAKPAPEGNKMAQAAKSFMTGLNPLMMRKSFEDAARTVVGGAVLPVVAPISAGIQAVNALPGNLYRRYRGEEEVKTPSTEELMQKYGEAIAPRTEMGQAFQEGLGKAFETAKVPHAWPLTPSAPTRPLLTPTDVRVGAGQIKQLAKELRETPADFQAAQSGLKRQNLYGEDTLGVKAQAAADVVGDIAERRRSEGKSLIPGVPQALTPETSLYAVRPKGTRMVQPKVPASAKGFRPDVSPLEGVVEDVYGDTPAAQMPPEMISSEYARRFLTPDSELAGAFKNYMTLKVQEMFPDAPTPRAAQNAYDTLYSNKTERTKQQMAELEEFLNLPENAAYRESTPTPSEFMQRMGEAERVIKGPFTTYLSKNIGAEGDPTVKLARQGITFETPEEIFELAKFADAPELAANRLEAGFPIMGTYAEEGFQKSAELDALNQEIEALEAIRRPLFDQAHAEGIDPASIPEYAETTNPLRQKLRQQEQLQGELENIKLAKAVEDISDSAIELKTKKEMLERIPFEQRQFYPGVTKAGEGEKLYMGRESIIRDLGFKKLGRELLEDILTGKAGDTSKLTIENYMREKGLSRIEAEKAVKLQEQKYRETLQNTLLDRLRNDQNVKTFGNTAIITLDENTPKDVAMRDMSADTAVLDHCVGQCGTAPKGRKNILTGKQQYYEPVIDPITGERSSRAYDDTSYVRDLQNGYQLVSVRDVNTGLPAATLELIPSPEMKGKFRIGYVSGAKNGSIDPAYVSGLRDYLNQRSSEIYSPGSNLADNTGIFDTTSPAEFKKAAREAGLNLDQAKRLDREGDLPRFATVDDIKATAKGLTSTEVAVEQVPAPQRPAETVGDPIPEYLEPSDLLEGYRDRLTPDQISWLEDWTEQFEEALGGVRTIEDINDPVAQNRAFDLLERYDTWRDGSHFFNDPLANLFDDLEPDNTAAAANNPLLGYNPNVRELALRYNIPPVTVQEIQSRFRDIGTTIQDLNDMARNAINGAPRTVFANLPEESRLGAEQMIRDEIGRRVTPLNQIGARGQEQLPAPAPRQAALPAAPMARAVPVPRHIRDLGVQELIQDMSPAWNRQAQELADLYFNENTIDGPNISIGTLTDMLRDYRIGPHAEAPNEVRELAARRLEQMHSEAESNAEQIADALNDAFFMDMDPQEAIQSIQDNIRVLEEHGEAGWEDIVGPMIEDMPWNRNVQHHLIGYLRALMERYGEQRDNGYAKGGRVKKKRKAKSGGIPLVLTRKSPELTEMAYQYGGLV